MTLETLDVKLHFFSFPSLLLLSALRLLFSGEGKYSLSCWLKNRTQGDILYHLHISITPELCWNKHGKRRKFPWISLQDADKMAATVRRLAHLFD